jgi:hypothetical protein
MTAESRRAWFITTLVVWLGWIGALGVLAAYSAKAPRERPQARAE